MKLPIPFEAGGSVVSEIELQNPTAGLLAETSRTADAGRFYAAISVLLAGCIAGEDNPKTLVKAMPYRSAEYASLMAVLQISPDDGFEGVYPCPRCGFKLVSEQTEDDDGRDFVSRMDVGYLDEPGTVQMDLLVPVQIKSKGETVDEISSLEMRYPTMGDCESAEKAVGNTEPLKTQFELYARALLAVNGEAVNDAWRHAVGALVFKKLDARDMATLSHHMSAPGLDRTVEKACPSCGKVYRAEVNTAGFFESVLHST